MTRIVRYGFLLCSLLGLVCTARAQAQDAAVNIAKAQQTLSEIDRLLDQILARGSNASRSATAAEANWESLFDGKSLTGWKRTDFSGGGAVHLEQSFRGGPAAIVVEAGSSLSGFNWTGEAPKMNYEITLEAMKIEGSDFLCGLTFPVGDSHASLILGGWGGLVVGISSIDNQDASENETTRTFNFVKNHWYAVRMRVTPKKLEAWLDEQKMVDVVITDRRISLRFGEISKSVPLGLATYQTSAAFRAIKLRRLETK